MSESFQKESLGTLAPDQEGFHDKGISTSVLLNIISLVTHLISISHSPIQIIFILTLQQSLLIEVGELGLQDRLLNPGILVHLLKAILATDHPKELDAMSVQ